MGFSRRELREIAKLQQDRDLVSALNNTERLKAYNPSLSAVLSGRDTYTGRSTITDLNGGTKQAQSITTGYIAPLGGIIPATFKNGSFNTIDAMPISSS